MRVGWIKCIIQRTPKAESLVRNTTGAGGGIEVRYQLKCIWKLLKSQEQSKLISYYHKNIPRYYDLTSIALLPVLYLSILANMRL